LRLGTGGWFHEMWGISLLKTCYLLRKETRHSQETDISAPGGIRTRNPRKRAAARPRLKTARPMGSASNFNVNKYKTFKRKDIKCIVSTDLNKMCITNNVLPNSAKIKKKPHLCQTIFDCLFIEYSRFACCWRLTAGANLGLGSCLGR